VQLVIDAELSRYVRRAIREPWQVDAETTAAEVIDAVGPGGIFLGEPHTLKHFRDELFFSPLFRSAPWEQSHSRPEQFDQTRKAAEIAAGLWRPPAEPVLDGDQIRAIDAIVHRATSS
jgi:trimethylamine--corrinoid protein Co-methyltransferase